MLKSLDLGMPKLCECICPACRAIHSRIVEGEYLSNPYAWIVENRPVILCATCRPEPRLRRIANVSTD